jgi:hypothetical protein
VAPVTEQQQQQTPNTNTNDNRQTAQEDAAAKRKRGQQLQLVNLLYDSAIPVPLLPNRLRHVFTTSSSVLWFMNHRGRCWPLIENAERALWQTF